MINYTFKIQSAKVILDIEGQVYGEWILPLIYCQLLIWEFVSTFLFTKSKSHCKNRNMMHGLTAVSKHELSMKYLLNLSKFCSVYFRRLACKCVHMLSAMSFHQGIVLMGVLAGGTGQKCKKHGCTVTFFMIFLALRKERYLVNLDSFASLQLMGIHCYAWT